MEGQRREEEKPQPASTATQEEGKAKQNGQTDILGQRLYRSAVSAVIYG